MSHQDGLGNDGPKATGASKPDDRHHRLQKKSENLAHAHDGIKSKKLKNSMGLANSPTTRTYLRCGRINCGRQLSRTVSDAYRRVTSGIRHPQVSRDLFRGLLITASSVTCTVASRSILQDAEIRNQFVPLLYQYAEIFGPIASTFCLFASYCTAHVSHSLSTTRPRR